MWQFKGLVHIFNPCSLYSYTLCFNLVFPDDVNRSWSISCHSSISLYLMKKKTVLKLISLIVYKMSSYIIDIIQ